MMKTTKWSKLHSQDFDWQQDSQNNKNSFKNAWAKFEQKIAKKLANLGDRWTRFSTYSEPKIWERKDRDGNPYFRIFDPKSDRYIYLNSEDEVRWWLDERYYL
ncbi:hypothetical protein IQ255_03035 [Pleurocapsales cyanobacterium LEGE 10410]|nr:hypothetical protein [Pleurocapsales cyanobacterium LEGE 10410]